MCDHFGLEADSLGALLPNSERKFIYPELFSTVLCYYVNPADKIQTNIITLNFDRLYNCFENLQSQGVKSSNAE